MPFLNCTFTHMKSYSPTSRIKVNDCEWSLLDKLTTNAQMDWFWQETVRNKQGAQMRKKTLTHEQIESSYCAFMHENFHGFTREELLKLLEFFARYGVADDFGRRELSGF